MASRNPIAPSSTVPAPPRPRSSRMIAVTSAVRPGCRRAVSYTRIASPPIDVGSTWLAAYETKYARVSHAKLSSMRCARISHCQRRAMGRAVPIMIPTASRNHHGLASTRMSTVWWMSIFQTR